jgi:lipoprotein-anchoring transpeptidase ErfK/SrfK
VSGARTTIGRLARRTIAAFALVALIGAAGCAGARPRLEPASPAAAAPAPGKTATVDPRDGSVVATAAVPKVDIYTAPDPTQPPSRTLLNPIASGGPLVFLVEESRAGWHRVLLPVRPNGSTGWIRAGDVTLARHEFRIEVHLAEFRLDVRRRGQLIMQAPIGVARDNTPTPGGRYYTTELLRPPTPNSVYGTYAYGLSGFSDVLEAFNGGPGQLGIHGTNDPASIGQRVSAGCVRLRNEDMEKLVSLLPLGVPVAVFA